MMELKDVDDDDENDLMKLIFYYDLMIVDLLKKLLLLNQMNDVEMYLENHLEEFEKLNKNQKK